MTDSIDLGVTPSNEECVAFPYRDITVEKMAFNEAKRYKKQLTETFPSIYGTSFKIVQNPYDASFYYSIEVRYSELYPDAIDFAYFVDENAPQNWIDEKEFDAELKKNTDQWNKDLSFKECKLSLGVGFGGDAGASMRDVFQFMYKMKDIASYIENPPEIDAEYDKLDYGYVVYAKYDDNPHHKRVAHFLLYCAMMRLHYLIDEWWQEWNLDGIFALVLGKEDELGYELNYQIVPTSKAIKDNCFILRKFVDWKTVEEFVEEWFIVEYEEEVYSRP